MASPQQQGITKTGRASAQPDDAVSDLMADHPDAWPCLTGTNPAQFRIKPMTQAEACTAYFNRLMELLATTHRARAAA